MAAFFLLTSATIWGQGTNQAPGQPSEDPKPFQWSAELDAYAERNANHPLSEVNELRAFDNQANSLRLAGSTLDLEYKSGAWGTHLTAGYGDAFRAIAETDRLRGANSFLTQYYVSYRPLKDRALQFDGGKFYTSVGAEIPDPDSNFNYSRSLLFTLGEPYFHFGFRASIPVSKKFTAGAQLLNGWNSVGAEDLRTLGLTTSLTGVKWSWSQTLLLDVGKPSLTQGRVYLVNQVLTVNARPSVQSYAELLYGQDQGQRTNAGLDRWYGAALATRWSATKRLSLTPRLEYFADQTGLVSGTRQHLREWTATGAYRFGLLVEARLEIRHDQSDHFFFKRSSGPAEKDQNTVILAVLVKFKGER